MRLVYKILLVSFVGIAYVSCGGGGDDSPPPEPPMEMVPDPKATTLVFPENNTECNEGEIVNDLTSRVIFRWNASDDTDSYEVNLINLNTNQAVIVNSATEQSQISIRRGTPYEWFVISKATGTTVTASSATFKFYNQGPGVQNYAPFPAEVVAPARGADLTDTEGVVTLMWTGSDVDEDITGYEILFGTNEIPSESIGTTAENSFDTNVTAGNTYYWRVISEDSANNTSQSEIFEFKVSS